MFAIGRYQMNAAAQNWKAAREAAGLSALQAAELVGVHRNTIYDLENVEKDGVTLRIMKRAAAVYGITLGEIFREDDDTGRAPRELQPLAEVLAPLPVSDRESVVRNIVANLLFMARIAGGGVGKSPSRDTPRVTEQPTVPFVGGVRQSEGKAVSDGVRASQEVPKKVAASGERTTQAEATGDGDAR